MFDVSQPNEADYPDLVRAAERSHATMTAHLEDLAAQGLFAGDPETMSATFTGRPCMGRSCCSSPAIAEPPLDARALIAGLYGALVKAQYHPACSHLTARRARAGWLQRL